MGSYIKCRAMLHGSCMCLMPKKTLEDLIIGSLEKKQPWPYFKKNVI